MMASPINVLRAALACSPEKQVRWIANLTTVEQIDAALAVASCEDEAVWEALFAALGGDEDDLTRGEEQ